MKIGRMFFEEFFNKPEEYYSLEKLRKAIAVDRRLTLREIFEKVFDFISRFMSKDELKAPSPCPRICERLGASQRVYSVGGEHGQSKKIDYFGKRNGNLNYFNIKK